MRFSIAFLGLCIVHGVHCIFRGGNSADSCSKDVLEDYRKSTNAFCNKLFIQIAARCDNHFVFSPNSIWLSLAALAEGADSSVQNQLFSSLNLPQQSCLRNKFYDIAMNIERSGRDVILARKQILAIDDSVNVFSSWVRRSHGLLSYGKAPIKSEPATAVQNFRQFLHMDSKINLNGDSILLDSLFYQGLWTTALDEAKIQPQPFFNELGQKIGIVDMMRMKKRVRLAHVPFMNAKVLELPVGDQGRFTMLISICTGNNIISNAIQIFMGSIQEIFSLLQMSLVPLDIAIPKFALTSEFDLRPELEEIGIRAFWRDPAATKYVSNPPAKPSGFIQRVSIEVDRYGVELPPRIIVDIGPNTATGEATVGHEFVADRPFMFAFFDTKTHTCIFAGSFSKPSV